MIRVNKLIGIFFAVLFINLVITIKPVFAANPTTWANDFPNIPTDKSNVMNQAQAFRIFSRNLNGSNQPIEGNIATQNYVTSNGAAFNSSQKSYIQNRLQTTDNSDQLNISNTTPLVLGSDFSIVSSWSWSWINPNPLKIKGKGTNDVVVKLDGTNNADKISINQNYVNFDAVFSQLTANSDDIFKVAQAQQSKPIIIVDPSYSGRVTIDATAIASTDSHIKVIPVAASDLQNRKIVILKGVSDDDKIIFAITPNTTNEEINLNNGVKFYKDKEGAQLSNATLFVLPSTYQGNINLGFKEDIMKLLMARTSFLAANATLTSTDGVTPAHIAAKNVNWKADLTVADDLSLFSIPEIAAQNNNDNSNSDKNNDPNKPSGDTGTLGWATNTFQVDFGRYKIEGNKLRNLNTGGKDEILSNMISGQLSVIDSRPKIRKTKQKFYIALQWTKQFTNEKNQPLNGASISMPLNSQIKKRFSKSEITIWPNESIWIPNSSGGYDFKLSDTGNVNNIKNIYKDGIQDGKAESQWGIAPYEKDKTVKGVWSLNPGKVNEINPGTYSAVFTWILLPKGPDKNDN